LKLQYGVVSQLNFGNDGSVSVSEDALIFGHVIASSIIQVPILIIGIISLKGIP